MQPGSSVQKQVESGGESIHRTGLVREGVGAAEENLRRLHWRLRGQVPSHLDLLTSVGPDLSGKASGLRRKIFGACIGVFGDKSPPTLDLSTSVGPDLSGKASGLRRKIFGACTGVFGDKSPPTLDLLTSVGPDLSGKASGVPRKIFGACIGIFGDKSPPTWIY
jgi:hypothetical protein